MKVLVGLPFLLLLLMKCDQAATMLMLTTLVTFIVTACYLTGAEKNHIFMCGTIVPVHYDNTTEDCINNTIVTRKPASRESTTTKPSTTITTTSASPPTPSDIPQCPSKGRKGVSCCNKTPYRKDFQTCCTMGHHTFVHENRPQRKYVCCPLNHLQVFPRSQTVLPCLIPSLNDRLSRPKRYKRQNYCGFSYAYSLQNFQDIKNRHGKTFRPATLQTLPLWGAPGTNNQTYEVEVQLDNYNKRRKYRHVLILTDFDYTRPEEKHFFLRSKDVVIRPGKNLNKLLNNMKKRCKIRGIRRTRRHRGNRG